MFKKLLGNSSSDKSSANKLQLEIQHKIFKMNLTDMRAYLKGNISDFKVCEIGLSELMDKLLKPDEKTSKFYIELSDMDTKKKKAFELILLVAQSRRISIDVVEKIQKFIEVYQEIILKYDTQHKQIYGSKLNDALSNSLNNLNKMSEYNNKMQVLKE